MLPDAKVIQAVMSGRGAMNKSRIARRAAVLHGLSVAAKARRLVGVLVCVSLGVAAPASADVITDWNAFMLSTIGAAPPGAGPSRVCEMAMVHIAMHDAVQAIQQRFETYSPAITPAAGSVIAAASKAARDVLVAKFPPQAAAIDAAYQTYLTDNQLSSTDPGVAAGAQAAAAIIQMRVGDGTYPVPAPTFFGGTEPGQWRPTALNAAGEPLPMAGSWLATSRPFAVMHSSQMFSGAPPRMTSRKYTREYNEVKALGRNVGSTRTPEQTALAVFYSDSPPSYWNRTMRSLTDKYIKDVGESARMFALVNIALADAIMTAWQSKIHHNFWRPITAIRLGDTDGNRHTAGDPTWQSLYAAPNYPDYTSGATSLAGAAAEMLRLFFRTDRVNFSLIGATSNRDYTRFSDVAADVVDARIYMGIHFRSPDAAGRSSGQRVSRWTYRYFLRSVDGDDFDFVRSLDAYEEVDRGEEDDEGQDDDDAERPGAR